VVIEKDMPPAICQRIRQSLWVQQGQIRGGGEEERQGFRHRRQILSFPTAVLTDIVIKADHEQGKLHVRRRICSAGSGIFSVPAQEVSDDMLEDFARAMIGQQSEIRKYRVRARPGCFAERPRASRHRRAYLRSISSILYASDPR